MKIRMKTLYAGPDGTIQPGQIGDLPSETAEVLIEGGYAEHPEAAAIRTETATARAAAETAALRTAGPWPKAIRRGLHQLSDGTEFRGNKKAAVEAEDALRDAAAAAAETEAAEAEAGKT